MCPASLGPVPGRTSNLRRVSIDPSHYRSGRRFLLGEGAIVGALGVLALVDAATDTGYGPAGAPVLGLWLNAAQGGLLLGFAMLAVVAAVKRRTAVIFSAVAAVGWATLLVACMAAAARGVYGPLGFDARDGLLYGALAVYHLALLLWFEADQLEGPAWVRERRSSSSPGADSQPR